jgi:type IV secretory pathway VirB10-like protein
VPGEPARPLTRTGRPARAARPAALPPARAVTGALVAVAGVALGIGTLLWATGGLEAPAGDPVVRPPAAMSSGTEEQPAAEAVAEPLLDEPAVPALDEEPAPAEVAPEPAPPPPAPAPAPPAPAPQQAAPARVEVPVLVLNNSRISGLAERAARYFEAGGWPVRDTGNSRGRIRATTIYYPPGQEAAAREFARRFPEVKRVLPRLENLPGDGLTVVVTRDFSS